MAANTPPPPPSVLFFNGLFILAFLSIPFIALRILFLLPPLRPPPRPRRRPGAAAAPPPTSRSSSKKDDAPTEEPHSDSDSDSDTSDDTPLPTSPTHLLIILGSGGHTAEMFAMLSALSPTTFLRSYTHRTYVISAGDHLSASRARTFEQSLLSQTPSDPATGTATATGAGTYTLHTIPRARAIHQPLLTTPLSALRTLLSALALLRTRLPDLILTNGPGTGVVVAAAALALRFADVGDGRGTSRMRTVYVESWARVRRLSLSGRLLCRVADRFVVQWEGLVGEASAGRGEFLGVLV